MAGSRSEDILPRHGQVAAATSNRRATMQEIHPSPDQSTPNLPAAPLADYEETDLHHSRWAGEDDSNRYPNWWARFRHHWKEEWAEFWGTFMIIIFGCGVECQTSLHYRSALAYGDYLQCRFAWAAGVAMAVWVAGGISGGHCNPTVTISLWIYRGFPTKKVPGFILFQVLGATLAALLIYTNYSSAIEMYEGGSTRTIMGPNATAGCFFTVPQRYLPYANAAYTEFLCSAVLLGGIFALSDKANLAPPLGTMPICVFLLVLGIGSALGVNTGYAMNGARDTGPRIALSIMGYGPTIWTHDYGYWLWAPWISSIFGGIIGGLAYDSFLYTGRDSPVNRPSKGTFWQKLSALRVRDNSGVRLD